MLPSSLDARENGMRRSKIALVTIGGMLLALLLVVSTRIEAAEPIIRINAGGPHLIIGPWAIDNNDDPSPHSNSDVTSAIVTTTDPQTASSSVPSSTNTNMFKSHRFDPPGGGDMEWDIPMADGGYIVTLYFSETADTTPGETKITGPGQRIFDVSIEGELLINDLDVYAVAGDNDIGIARSFIIEVNDGLQLDFGREVQNPMVSGIEVTPVDSTNNPLEVVPSALTFVIDPNSSQNKTTEFINGGDPSAPTVFLTNTSITGSGSADFSDDFSGPVTLAPGSTHDVTVTFDAPASEGQSDATLSMSTNGAGTPAVTLRGVADADAEPSELGTSHSSLSFGTVALDDTKAITVELTNEGMTLDLILSSVEITGPDAAEFSVSGAPASLAPGASADVTVTFDPDSSGSKQAALRIDHDGENGPTTLSMSATAGTPPPPPSAGFIDIESSIFTTEINWLADTGITKGCNPPTNNRFCPEDPVTRGQMAAFIHRALDDILTPGPSVEFVDDNDSTFEADIEWLGATGVTKGCNPPANDRFCPNEPVTRGQMAAFLHRALEGELELTSFPTYIDDNDSTFEADIEWLGATGVTRGCNPPANDRFCPNEPVTREQMAAFLFRALAER